LSLSLEPSGRSPLKPYLLLDPEDDKGVDLEFLGEAVRRFEEDESIKPAFIAAVEEMSRDLAAMTINDDYKSYLIVPIPLAVFPSRFLLLTYLGSAKPGW
jgi:ubiquitin conjugation factor E4 B